MAQPIMSINWIAPSEVDLKECEGKIGTIVIRVLKEDEKHEAMKLIMAALFLSKDHPIISALQFDAVSMELLDRWIKLHLNQNIVFGCFVKEKDLGQGQKNKLGKICGQEKTVIEFKLVAVDVLYVRNTRDVFPDPTKVKGEAFLNLMKYIKRVEQRIWSKDVHKICNILTSFGIFATDEFKKDLRITKGLIKNRNKLGKQLKIEVLGAACVGKDIAEAKTEFGCTKSCPKTYEIVHIFQSEDVKELGLDSTNVKYLTTIFPINIMAAKQRLESKSDAEVSDEARRKRIKVENDDN